MSTPSHPDEEPAAAAGPATSNGRASAASGDGPAGSGSRGGTDTGTAAVGAPSSASESDGPAGGGSTGTPPPWARGGALTSPPSPKPSPRPGVPPSGGGPGAGRPGGGPGAGRGPDGPGRGPDGPGQRGPAPGAAGSGAGSSSPGDERRQRSSSSSSSKAALIDAPTNQLSPEQLGMRLHPRRSRSEAGPTDDEGADLGTARPSTSSAASGKAKSPRRASLQVKRFDPWSVLKLALVLGVALFFVWMFAVGVLYAVLDGMGVWAQLNGTYQDLTSDTGGGSQLITAGGVFGVAAIIGVVNTILFTALASVSAFIYNISADVAGGIEVMLSERD